MNIDRNVTEVCSTTSNKQYPSIDSDNGLATIKRPAIIWVNYGLAN